jgi:hypothetical protein
VAGREFGPEGQERRQKVSWRSPVGRSCVGALSLETVGAGDWWLVAGDGIIKGPLQSSSANGEVPKWS